MDNFDEKIFYIVKWLVAIGLFCFVIIPFQIIFVLLWPIIKFFKKKHEEKSGVYIDMEHTWPIDYYGKLAKRFLGLD